MRWRRCLLLFAAGSALAADEVDLRPWEDGSDLESFVSRPDIKAPRLVVSKHRPDLISDGYWFMTPYSHFDDQPRTKRKEFSPCQTGAHIYDSSGTLVWSGACWGGNRNIFGFRPITVDGQQYLTLHLPGLGKREGVPPEHQNASGIVLNNRYQEISRTTLHENKLLDFHEFNVQPGGKTAIVTTMRQRERDSPEIKQGKRKVVDYGFQEVDVHSGAPTFTWDPLEHGVLLNESCNMRGKNSTSTYWDFLHINSVDKNPDGDYFVSGRHTSTIYKVSGSDGHVIWRLGGNASDFHMEQGLHFAWQHDIRFRSQNETHTIISLFDNTGEDEKRNPQMLTGVSSGKIISLDTASKPMTARVLRKFDRPDGKWSSKLGNVQILGNNVETDSVLVNWAIQGYVSEHVASGDCVMEAKFESGRMSSYRAYKHPFVGIPAEPPALKIMATTLGETTQATSFYVSWNGATEVAFWNFYAGFKDVASPRKVGSVAKTGFEDTWVLSEHVPFAFAEAIDKKGNVLGQSAVQSISPLAMERPQASSPPGVSGAQGQPTPQSEVVMAPHIRIENASGWMITIVYNSFALWGFYCMVRKFFSKELRWR